MGGVVEGKPSTEMRLNLLQKRECASPCEPPRWKGRVLPEAGVRLATCAIADCRKVGASWKKLSERMGLGQSSELSVIADGAAWIWEQARKRLKPAGELVRRRVSRQPAHPRLRQGDAGRGVRGATLGSGTAVGVDRSRRPAVHRVNRRAGRAVIGTRDARGAGGAADVLGWQP